MGKMSSSFLIFTMFLVAELVICCSAEDGNRTSSGCIPSERNALLKFKASLSDPYNRLSSWNATIDCCKWASVYCDHTTGHVIGLDLQNKRYDLYSSANMLHSETLDSSIVHLKHLAFLDLSGNNFHLSFIPSFIGSLYQMQHLNLSCANFGGVVPHHLGNLSSLRVLDLSENGFHQLKVDDFTWVSRLSLLKHLNMSMVDLSPTKDLLKVVNVLSFLVDIRFSSSRLENRNLEHGCVDTSAYSHLECLDLSNNSFHGELPCFLENMTSLKHLRLSHNNYSCCGKLHLFQLANLVQLNLGHNTLPCSVDSISELILGKNHLEFMSLNNNSCHGDISKIFLSLLGYGVDRLEFLFLGQNRFYGQLPEEIRRFQKLQTLDLAENYISGPIPTSIGNLSALRKLNLKNNQLNGEIPNSLGQLSSLERLFLSDNYLDGRISESHFSKLSNLRYLWIGNNSFKFVPISDWIPCFQLYDLDMRSCDIGGEFPQWLQTQKELQFLSLFNCSISEPLPYWAPYVNMTYLDLSQNRFEGAVHDSLCKMKSLSLLDLSENNLSGSLPECLVNLNMLQILSLSSNRLSGVIPGSIGGAHSLWQLELSNNGFTGELPSALGNCTQLRHVDVSRNRLSGHLPEIWANLSMLSILKLSLNHLSGVIPNFIGRACSLEWLQLSGNRFTGELPPSLRNCSQLRVLDVGENMVSGQMSKWIGSHLLNLKVLRLSSNDFYGTIPSNLCQLSELQILDLANNQLTGNIPYCFDNFTSMISYKSTIESFAMNSLQLMTKGVKVVSFVTNSLQLMIKSVVLEYNSTLKYVVYMDLSNNNLAGEVPVELTRLSALHFLNLSHNHLHGHIPERVGDMNSLESLDLSNNNLSGTIPSSISYLTFLSHLNLSHNNLTGEIPTGHQLQTLQDSSAYEGNPELCGAPLTKKCDEEKASNVPDVENHVVEGEELDDTEKIWFSGVVITGFATGFWGVIGVLLFNSS